MPDRFRNTSHAIPNTEEKLIYFDPTNLFCPSVLTLNKQINYEIWASLSLVNKNISVFWNKDCMIENLQYQLLFSWIFKAQYFLVVQLLSPVQLFATPWTAACHASLSFTISWNLLQIMSIESVMRSNHLVLCRPFLLLSSTFSMSGFFPNESALCIKWPKYWSFHLSINPSSENLELISFRIDCFDLPAVQVTLKSLLQHHSLKASIFWCLAFFTVQLSYLYMSTEKILALTQWTFVGKVVSLLFHTLSRLVIAFLPRSKQYF